MLSKMSIAKSIEKLKSASLTGITQADENACHNFSYGNPQKKEFFSPNYPNEYPKNTKCTFRITADAGHMVMLDFRDQFHLEDSATCEYDKLEVRDGAYGYSPLIGTFCGNEFPKKMYSSKRYMWLQFSSDDSIEYTGFKAVYDYVPIPNQGPNGQDNDRECAFHRSGPSGIIQKSEIDPLWEKYRQDDTLECMWTIEADAGKKIYLNFNHYKLKRPNDCDQNFIQIFSDGRTPDKELAKFCGTTAEPQKSQTNVTHIRLFTHKEAFKETNFTLHYTSFREITKDDVCDPKLEFSCGDQTCVDISLKCDGEFDCKYRYDEEASICARALGASVVLTSEHMIIILVVFFALVIAMCVSISISCYNKIKERQLREREYKERRSKEASVEATIDRNLRDHSTPERALEKRVADQVPPRFRDEEEESSDGCYVPEVDLSVFKHPNGGESITKKPRAAGIQQQQQYPYISESFESLESDVIVPPAPPPVPPHLKERRDLSPPPPTYRIVGGKVIANPAKNEPERALQESRASTIDSKESGYGRWPPQESRPGSTKPAPGGYNRPIEKIDSSIRTLDKEPTGPTDLKSNFLRGPLEAGAPRSTYSRSPSDIGLPKFGMARVTPDGPRGPLAGKTPSVDKGMPLATFRRPYEPTPYPGGYRPPAARNYLARNAETDTLKTQPGIDASDKDSSRAHSVASTLSAPDVIGKR